MARLPEGGSVFTRSWGKSYTGPSLEARHYCVECGERVSHERVAHLLRGHTVARRLVEVSNSYTYTKGPKKRYAQM